MADRKWCPADWMDEVPPALGASPDEFLKRTAEGVQLFPLDVANEEPEDIDWMVRDLNDGDEVTFIWHETRGRRTLTIEKDGRWSLDEPFEPDTNCFEDANGMLEVDLSIESVVQALREFGDGEYPIVEQIDGWTWSDGTVFRLIIEGDTARFEEAGGGPMTTLDRTRRGDWMQTFTGKVIYPLDPDPADFDIVDIAHALSMACRYAGHVRQFYSVAEHCVLMSRHFQSLPYRRWALMHDATEAYLVDVPRPVKPFLAGYREAESELMQAIALRFGLDGDMPAAVKDADNRILCDEREQAMAPCVRDWNIEGPPLGVTLRFWTPVQAEREFLIAYGELFGGAP